MISRKYPSTRLRRLRQSESIIDLTSECMVTKNDLIQPLFVKEGLSDKEPIESMPGIFRFGEESILKEIEEIDQLGIKAIAIFPVIDPSKKDSRGTEAIKRDNYFHLFNNLEFLEVHVRDFKWSGGMYNDEISYSYE